MQFIEANDFSEGLSIAFLEDGYGYVNEKAENVIPFKYDTAYDFENGVASVIYNDELIIINTKGERQKQLEKQEQLLMEKYDLYGDMENGNGAKITMLDEKFGIINSNGEEVVECIFDDIKENIIEGKDWLKVKVNGKYGIINSKGEIIVDLKYSKIESFNDGMALVERNGLCGYIDTTGKEVIECQYLLAQKFSEGLAYVSEITDTDQKSYYIDKENNKILDISKYGFGLPFIEGNAVVTDSLGTDGEFGVIDKTGRLIIGNFDN